MFSLRPPASEQTQALYVAGFSFPLVSDYFFARCDVLCRNCLIAFDFSDTLSEILMMLAYKNLVPLWRPTFHSAWRWLCFLLQVKWFFVNMWINFFLLSYVYFWTASDWRNLSSDLVFFYVACDSCLSADTNPSVDSEREVGSTTIPPPRVPWTACPISIVPTAIHTR